MSDVLLQLLSQLNSSVFVLLGILVVAGWALFQSGKWLEKFSQHDKRLDKVEAIHDKVVALSTKIDMIYDHTNPRPVISAHCPLALTPFGQEVAKAIEADKLFSKYADKLVHGVQGICPPDANAYDIQVSSLRAAEMLRKMLDAGETNSLKQVAFDKGMLFEDIFPIFGIILRDKILEDRKISVYEVDEHDPTRTK